MWRDLLFGAGGLLAVILTAVLGWAAKVLVPLLKEWLLTRMSQAQLKKLKEFVAAAVRAAEELLKGKPGSEKLQYVTDQILAAYDVVPSDILRGLIETEVDYLKGEPPGLAREKNSPKTAE